MERYYDIRIPDTGQEFERLCQNVCQYLFETPFNLYGRNGQNQNGIDLFCENFEICVQCKNYQGKDVGKRLIAELEKDIPAALIKFGSTMKKYLLATTALRDTLVQDWVEQAKIQYGLDIQILFWEDFQVLLRTNPVLMKTQTDFQSLMELTDSMKDTQVDKQLRLAGMLLSYHDFAGACYNYKKALESDVECARAYLGITMADHGIPDTEEFRAYHKNSLVYRDVNLRLAKEYADGELRDYMQTLSLPNCATHQQLANGYCDRCHTLICPDCTVSLPYIKNEAENAQPRLAEKNLCLQCADELSEHSRIMYRNNGIRILLQIFAAVAVVGLILVLNSFQMKSAGMWLGILGGIIGFFKNLGDENDGMGLIDFVIVIGVAVFLTPIYLIGFLLRRMYLLLRMQWMIHTDRRAARKSSNPYGRYIRTYFDMVDITKSLNGEEPEF